MLAVIRIARGSVATDAFSQCSLWILTSYVFSLRSQQRAGLHKSDDRFCWFSFQGIQIDGGFCRSGVSTKPLAAQHAPVHTFTLQKMSRTALRVSCGA